LRLAKLAEQASRTRPEIEEVLGIAVHVVERLEGIEAIRVVVETGRAIAVGSRRGTRTTKPRPMRQGEPGHGPAEIVTP